jgi:tRNA threonylcarbamoyladenosine biosynthesis protein TsaB
MVICIETATNICSVALCDNEGVVSLRENNDIKSHASVLTVFIDEMLKENHIKPSELEAVATAKGPGSYTGLRIGVSVAKGIAFAASIPLIGIGTTLSMYWGMAARMKISGADMKATYLCPMIDARRMEVYHAIYDADGTIVKDVCAEVINEDSFSEIPENIRLILYGDGAIKCRDIIRRKNVVFDDDFRISAAYMQVPVYNAIRNRHFENVAYFEPFYLKDFITTIPRKNILGN